MTTKYYPDSGKRLKYQNDLFLLSVLGLCCSRICKCMWPLQGEIDIYLNSLNGCSLLLLIFFFPQVFSVLISADSRKVNSEYFIAISF